MSSADPNKQRDDLRNKVVSATKQTLVANPNLVAASPAAVTQSFMPAWTKPKVGVQSLGQGSVAPKSKDADSGFRTIFPKSNRWNHEKATVSDQPNDFDDDKAVKLVRSADFTASYWVGPAGRTKAAYTHVTYEGVDGTYQLTVVGHVHFDDSGAYTMPGNAFIPGWGKKDDEKGDWDTPTPHSAALIISALPQSAEKFETACANRYPTKTKEK
jgi:hypothetical protein